MNPHNYVLSPRATDFMLETLESSDDSPEKILIRLEDQAEREITAMGEEPTPDNVKWHTARAFDLWSTT